MCLRPSGFPGALFLFSGLLSLTELLQSLAFGESPVGNQKVLIHYGPGLDLQEIIACYRIAFQ
jgi:hypothetical protein